jgi:hypothetical protein
MRVDKVEVNLIEKFPAPSNLNGISIPNIYINEKGPFKFNEKLSYLHWSSPFFLSVSRPQGAFFLTLMTDDMCKNIE